jgi:hypothetical protein
MVFVMHLMCFNPVQVSDFFALDCRMTRKDYLNTEEFIDAVAEELQSKLSPKSKL